MVKVTLLKKALATLLSTVMLFGIMLFGTMPATASAALPALPSKISITSQVLEVYLGNDPWGAGDWQKLTLVKAGTNTYNVIGSKEGYTRICFFVAKPYGYQHINYVDDMTTESKKITQAGTQYYSSDGNICPVGGTASAIGYKFTTPLDPDTPTMAYRFHTYQGNIKKTIDVNLVWTNIPNSPNGFTSYLNQLNPHKTMMLGAGNTMDYLL